MESPLWRKMKGKQRVQAEFEHLTQCVARGYLPQVHNLRMVGDSMWTFQLKDFDEGLPGGRNLNRDLRELKEQHGQDHIRMEATFPNTYPSKPVFLRLVSPRCEMYTGHVTAGGSICIDALVQSDNLGAWQSSFSVETILNLVLVNMVDCEKVPIRTKSGSELVAGPLRIDLAHRFHRDVIESYSLYEAQNSFNRAIRNKQRTKCLESKKQPDHEQPKEKAPVLNLPPPLHKKSKRIEIIDDKKIIWPLVLSSGITVEYPPLKQRKTSSQEEVIDLTEDKPIAPSQETENKEMEALDLVAEESFSDCPTVPRMEAYLAEIERKNQMKQAILEEEMRQKEAEASFRVAELERKLAVAKQRPMAAPPEEWTCHIGNEDVMILPLPVLLSLSWEYKCGRVSSSSGAYISQAPGLDAPKIYEMLQAEEKLFQGRVTRIFRVQKHSFWTKYSMCRSDIAEAMGNKDVNEKFLWHGAHVNAIMSILEEGFDARVSNLNGALGGGIYFSESASLSEEYSLKSRQGVIKQGPRARSKKKNPADKISTVPSISDKIPRPCEGELGMLLARVTLGVSGRGGTGIRRLPPGYHSAAGMLSASNGNHVKTYAVFDNHQAYPEFLVYFVQSPGS